MGVTPLPGHTVSYDPSHATSPTAAPGDGNGPHDGAGGHAVSYDPSHAGSSTAASGDGSQGNGAGHAGAYDPGHAAPGAGTMATAGAHATANDPSHVAFDPSHATAHASYDASTVNPHDQGHDGSTGNAAAATAYDPNHALADQTHSGPQAGSSGTAGDSPHAAEIAQHASGNEVT
jgi:hypothetical protein